MAHRNLRVIYNKAHIDIPHVCDLCDIDNAEFARMCFDERSPSVSIVRVKSQTFIEVSCCRVLLQAWMPEKVRYFNAAVVPRVKRTLTPAEKKAVAMNQDWKCAHCSAILRDYDVDHVEQQCLRNQNYWLEALCPNCHRKKTRRDRLFGQAIFEPSTTLLGEKPAGNIFANFMCDLCDEQPATQLGFH